VIVPFAISSATGTIAFQLVPSVVRTTTFTGALQSLLNSSGGPYAWRIVPLGRLAEFERWRQSVDVVTDAYFRLELPNPSWDDEPQVEALMTQLRALVATIRAKAAAGESLDSEADLFQQLLHHVRQDYGRAAVKGRDANGEETEWRSVGGGTVPLKKSFEVEAEEDQVPEPTLLDALAEGERETEAIEILEADDEETR
jgi:hypothetical protein